MIASIATCLRLALEVILDIWNLLLQINELLDVFIKNIHFLLEIF